MRDRKDHCPAPRATSVVLMTRCSSLQAGVNPSLPFPQSTVNSENSFSVVCPIPTPPGFLAIILSQAGGGEKARDSDPGLGPHTEKRGLQLALIQLLAFRFSLHRTDMTSVLLPPRIVGEARDL